MFKAVLSRFTELRQNFSYDGGWGDYFTREKQIDYGHPSKFQGKPVMNSSQYLYQKRFGAMMQTFPALEIDDEELFEADEKPVVKLNTADNLPTPVPNYLRSVLPPEIHPYIAKGCKKDCRTWLWKNETGREARMRMGSLDKSGKSSPGAVKPNSKFTFTKGIRPGSAVSHLQQ